ncbi:MAG TPA: hypothetical protein VHT73_09040 [Thermodesulfobacteriota bacterium]|nr:hypothetical protein [Thermodesulfobacteriota bacterium]
MEFFLYGYYLYDLRNMNINDVKNIFEQVSRLSSRVKTIKGEGAMWSYKFPDGSETRYILNEMKLPEELEDDIANVFIWLWNMKNYLKKALTHKCADSNKIESKVNSDSKLAICADIANLLKHGKLTKTRSGLFPKLGSLSYMVPQQSMKKITFRGNEVEFDYKDFENIEVKMSVVDSSGNKVGDAFEIINHTLNEWEQELKSI